jgi:hypothetical protein
VQLVELPVQRFFRLQSGNAGKYVVLSNTYATHKMCYNVSNMHEVMNSLGMRKDRQEAHFLVFRRCRHIVLMSSFDITNKYIKIYIITS